MSEQYPSRTRAWFTVFILMLAYILSFVDRQILSLLVGPIRSDLALSDTQISILMGFAFALFYTICGFPLGRLADSKSRRGLIAVGIVLWSGATAACGLAATYVQFLLGRIAVGVGEAALNPSAYSLIADSFPSERRATAMSVYAMGIYLGSGVAFLLGGIVIDIASATQSVTLPLVGELRTWQVIFLGFGAAGILFTLLVLAIKEPRRKGVGAGVAIPLGEVGRYMSRNRKTLLSHNLGFAGLTFAGYGGAAWIPTFFMRTYGWEPGQVGMVYGSIVAVFGCLGVICGGRLADWLTQRGHSDANMRVGVYAALGAIPTVVLYPLMDSGTAAAVIIAPSVFFLSMPFGVAAAALQEIMPNAMRGQSIALYSLIANLLGLGVGPTAVALVTDYGFGDDASLRYSLLIVMSLALLFSVVVLGRGLKHYRASVEFVRRWAPESQANRVLTAT